jgi:alanine racemase
MIPSSFNRVIIDREALLHNYTLLRKKTGEVSFLAMVKADAYGHGMIACSKILEENGCTIFGVAELREAVLLRQSGITSAIFTFVGFDRGDAGFFCEFDITPVVYDVPSLEALSGAAVKSGKELSVHLKVDTGMNRLGVYPEGVADLLATVKRLPGLRLGGIASHFPCADDRHSPDTPESYARFAELTKIRSSGASPIYHIANSGGILYFPESRCEMVRCGISLYGYYPEGRDKVAKEGLHPVMSFTTRVLQVKSVPAGSGVSYGHTYVTEKPTVLAVLPVGYEDGFSRQLSNCGEVLIRGRRAIVRGRVCMNLCMVDVTEIEGVTAGDEVVILGRQGDEQISADEIASRIGSISYEVLCMIGKNNEREYRGIEGIIE